MYKFSNNCGLGLSGGVMKPTIMSKDIPWAGDDPSGWAGLAALAEQPPRPAWVDQVIRIPDWRIIEIMGANIGIQRSFD